MNGELTVANIDHGRGIALIIRATHACFGATNDAVHWLGRNAVIDGIHHPAYRAAAIQQGSRSAHHINLLYYQRVDGHGVIKAQ